MLVQAGAAEQGLEIAASSADVVYSAPLDIAAAQAYYANLKGRLRKYGREADSLKIMPGVTLFIGRTRDEAREKYDFLNSLVPPELGLSYLYAQMGDLSDYPVDGPVPEPTHMRVKSMAKNLYALAQRDNLSIRQLYTTIAAGFGGRVLIGTAKDIADDMQAWVEGDAADGFNLCPPVLPLGLDEVVEMLLPELRARWMFRTEYAGPTLRENLGLAPPRNRHLG